MRLKALDLLGSSLVVVTCSRDLSWSENVCLFADRCGSRDAWVAALMVKRLVVLCLCSWWLWELRGSREMQGTPGCGDSGARDGATDIYWWCSNVQYLKKIREDGLQLRICLCGCLFIFVTACLYLTCIQNLLVSDDRSSLNAFIMFESQLTSDFVDVCISWRSTRTVQALS